MKSSTASSSGNGSEYEQYMKQLYMKKGDPSMAGLSFTHTRIPSQEHGVSGGTFYIPQEKLPEFWAKYAKHVIVNRRHEYLTEKQLAGAGPVLVDLDFRYDPSVEKRQHSKEDVENIVGIYMDELSKLLDIQEAEKRDIAVFVFEKPSMNTDDEKYTKDGIHIIIGVHADRVVQYMLRNNVMKKVPDILKHLPLKNSWDDILDDNISRMVNPVGWQLYGSRKPGHEAYELKYHFNFTYIKSEVDTDLSDGYDCDGGSDGGESEECESEELGGGGCSDGDDNGDGNCKMEIRDSKKSRKNEIWEWEYDEKNVKFFDYTKNFCLLSAQYDLSLIHI